MCCLRGTAGRIFMSTYSSVYPHHEKKMRQVPGAKTEGPCAPKRIIRRASPGYIKDIQEVSLGYIKRSCFLKGEKESQLTWGKWGGDSSVGRVACWASLRTHPSVWPGTQEKVEGTDYQVSLWPPMAHISHQTQIHAKNEDETIVKQPNFAFHPSRTQTSLPTLSPGLAEGRK